MTPQEQDYKAIRLCVERSHGSQLNKTRFLKKLEKNWKKGQVLPEAGGPGWRKALCAARLYGGNFSRWDGWEYRSDYAANCWLNRPLPIPMWDGIPTEHLFILAEEGIGDEVLFMSLLPEALCRARKVTVECDKRLGSVLKRSFPRTETVERKGTLSAIRDWLLTQEPFTGWILMGDLARYFRRDKSHFPGKPYLRPDPERVLEFEKFRGRVGVSWSGNHGRYSPQLFATAAAASQPSASVLNLQYDESSIYCDEAGFDLKNDLEGLFALCSVLGRVVSVSTSIAHIAGSVGTPVDVIHAPPGSGGKNDMDILNWKWPDEWLGRSPGKSPWYGSATVYKNLNQYEALRSR